MSFNIASFKWKELLRNILNLLQYRIFRNKARKHPLTNSAEHDQTARMEQSDQGLDCLS